MRSVRLWVVVVLMSFTALVLYVRGDVDHAPASLPLSEMPMAIDARTAIDVPLDQETLDILGKGIYLNRLYLPNRNAPAASLSDRMEIGLYIAYLPSQRTGQSIHSPQNCLPGAGWTIESSQVTHFDGTDGKTYQANDNLIVNGSSTQEVLYWYQLHGRSIASDYRAKIDTLADSIRYGRTDEALVRIITPVPAGEDRSEARDRAIKFAQQVVAMLPAYVPN
ncbi:MAG TPA: EpsI family protein [Acidobacteriaceae bacterium]|nr:EpsI family protein [Acidobacteriaceae bacterium]